MIPHLMSHEVDAELESWLDGKRHVISENAFATICSWFQTNAPGNQFALAAQGRYDALTLSLQIITELKAIPEPMMDYSPADEENRKNIVALAAVMTYLGIVLAESYRK